MDLGKVAAVVMVLAVLGVALHFFFLPAMAETRAPDLLKVDARIEGFDLNATSPTGIEAKVSVEVWARGDGVVRITISVDNHNVLTASYDVTGEDHFTKTFSVPISDPSAPGIIVIVEAVGRFAYYEAVADTKRIIPA